MSEAFSHQSCRRIKKINKMVILGIIHLTTSLTVCDYDLVFTCPAPDMGYLIISAVLIKVVVSHFTELLPCLVTLQGSMMKQNLSPQVSAIRKTEEIHGIWEENRKTLNFTRNIIFLMPKMSKYGKYSKKAPIKTKQNQ